MEEEQIDTLNILELAIEISKLQLNKLEILTEFLKINRENNIENSLVITNNPKIKY